MSRAFARHSVSESFSRRILNSVRQRTPFDVPTSSGGFRFEQAVASPGGRSLAAAGPSQEQQRSFDMRDGSLLLRIQALKKIHEKADNRDFSTRNQFSPAR